MRVDNIVLEELYFDEVEKDGMELSYSIPNTVELDEELNLIRQRQGYNDIVAGDVYNDVYYDFYLMLHTKNNVIKLIGKVNESEKDDYTNYIIRLDKDAEKELLWKALKQLAIDLYKEETLDAE